MLSTSQRTILSVALAACFAPMVSQASCNTGGSFTSNDSGTQSWGANDCSIATGISISGGSPALTATASVGTLTNDGIIHGGETGFLNTSNNTVGAIVNSGTISANSSYGIKNLGTIGSLVSTGSISSTRYVIDNIGLITTFDNQGTISGGTIAVYNTSTGTISTLTNSSTIAGSQQGIYNLGSISTLDNSGSITGNANGIYNGSTGNIATLTNSNLISGTTYAIWTDNNSNITSLVNTSTGTIRGNYGFFAGNANPTGTINIGTITNAGLINASVNVGLGTSSNATIGTLNNTGTISGVAGGIGNAGTIGSINNTGLITSATGYAIYNAGTGSIGPISNAGVIAGTIYNGATRSLTISGGSGSTFGTLTGASAGIGSADIGELYSTSANLILGSGNLLLNDNVHTGNYTITNAGATLQVNNQLSIDGRYSQGATGTLVIGVGNSAVSNGVTADTGYGRLTVSGSAIIASGSSVTLKALNSYAFAVGQRFLVVQAATNNTNYNASSLVYSAIGYNGLVTGATVIDGSNSNLVLTLGSSNGSSNPNISATTPNAVSAISGLFKYGGVNTSLLNVFNASAALGSTTAANRAGAQLSPSSNAMAVTQASSAPTQSVLNVAAAHVDGLRTAQAEGGSGVSTGEHGPNNALWGQVFDGKASQGKRDNISGYNADYNGLLIGGDRLVSDAWRVGGLFSYANTSINSRDDNAGSSASIKSYGLIAYAGYTADSWYLDMSGGVVRHKYSTTRLIDFTGFSGTANGSYDGTQSVLTAEGGYPIRLDDTTVLTPIAGLSYSKLNQNGYTETGGNGAALTVAANSSSSLKSSLGAKLERSYTTSYGSLSPSVQLAWRHEYRDTRLMSVASFAADTSGATTFTTFGAKPVTDTGVMALAATLARSSNMTLTARYTLEAGGGYKAQTADLRLRYQF